MSAPRVLYIASSGVNDPLVVSQVLRYLKRLRSEFETCHLITLERSEISAAGRREKAEELAEFNIHWHPQMARLGRRSINLWRDVATGYRTATRIIREHRLNVIHARSFVPGNIALQAGRRTHVPVLYDMRGFWAEEKFAKGTIRQPWMRSIAARIERRLFSASDALVSLTEAGKRKLVNDGIMTPIDVIPCCVDVSTFRWDGRPRNSLNEIVSVGSLGPGYLPSAVFGVYAAAQRINSDVRLQLLTRSDSATIERAARAANCDLSQISIDSATPAEVPRYLQKADIGLCMIDPSDAKIASSPTKLAEYLACGIPVIANCDGIGDMSKIVVDGRVGVDLSAFDQQGYDAAVAGAVDLLQDDGLSQRCRELAESDFSVDRGADVYASIYHRLVGDRP